MENIGLLRICETGEKIYAAKKYTLQLFLRAKNPHEIRIVLRDLKYNRDKKRSNKINCVGKF